MISARDLMTDKPVTLPLDARVRLAVATLQTMDIRHIPVVDEDGALAGIVSDRDLRALEIPTMVGEEYLGDLRAALDAPLSSIMTGDVISVDLEATASEIVDLMLENKIGAVPVLDGDGVLVGIVSYVDVLRAMPFEDEEDEERPTRTRRAS